MEVLRAIEGGKIAAREIAQLGGKQIPMGLTEASVQRLAFTMKEPIGVVVALGALPVPRTAHRFF